MRILLLTVLSFMATNTWADSPFYVGGGYGLVKLKQDVDVSQDVAFDDESGSYNLFVGFELTPRIAFEGGY
ncbi:MAG: outer membrane beta-barrel protein, partial [Gammaproteobacteria bacterium]